MAKENTVLPARLWRQPVAEELARIRPDAPPESIRALSLKLAPDAFKEFWHSHFADQARAATLANLEDAFDELDPEELSRIARVAVAENAKMVERVIDAGVRLLGANT